MSSDPAVVPTNGTSNGVNNGGGNNTNASKKRRGRSRNGRNNRGGRGGRGGGDNNKNDNDNGNGNTNGNNDGNTNNGNKNNNNNNRNRNRNRGRSNKSKNNNEQQANNNGTATSDNDKMEIDETPATTTTTVMAEDNNNAGRSRHQFSDTSFVDAKISNPSKRALTEVLQYEYMTKVQEATLPVILEGHDVVAKAKTGSGKTTAFLLPIIEQLAAATDSNNSNQFVAIVLSPTRELANQIGAEFQKLATFHPGMKKQSITMIGGTNIDKDKRILQSPQQKLRLLIATPGRLQDHLNQNTANIVQRLSQIKVLCLDEADRLLDMGFRPELERIMEFLPPPQQRQTLLFSATFPNVMKDITRGAMRQDYKLIDTLDENEADANVQVVQKALVTPLQHHMLAMEQVLLAHAQERTKFKIIVFFTTARIAGFMAELFRADPRYPQYNDKTLLEMHSRKSQSYRTNVAKKFTNESNVILFSSDVSARGVDYPDVSLVLQVGAPSEKAQYIHRLGRTARAGQSGIGILLLSDFERVFMKELEDLNVEQMPQTTKHEHATEERRHLQQLVQQDERLSNSAAAAYQAFLGYYNSNVRRLRLKNKHELVEIANEYSTVIGFPEGEPPALLAKTVGKMGLKDVPGINIDRGAGRGGGRGGGGRGGRGGGRGGRGGRR